MMKALWNASIRTHALLQKAPTNRLLNRLRVRENLRWGMIAVLPGLAYFGLAYLATVLINSGWTEWLYLIVALGIWNGLKLCLFGPWSIILLLRAKSRERRAQAHVKEPTIASER
ncbi:MAG: sulfate permease [Nocardioidaceae bacterium]|nr:sulfate permease [Nocardioidaceae bacterium]